MIYIESRKFMRLETRYDKIDKEIESAIKTIKDKVDILLKNMVVSSFMLCQNLVRLVKHPEEKRHVVDDPKSDVDEERTEMDDNDNTTHDDS